VGVTQ